MKNLLVLAALVVAPALIAAAPVRAADLTLDLATTAPGGRIAVALYGDAASLRRGQGAVRTLRVERTGATTRTVITGLPPGRYAVATFHDRDGNGALTLWPIGLPKEAYGFSNEARGRFGPPGFAAAAFDLPAGGARQAIRLR